MRACSMCPPLSKEAGIPPTRLPLTTNRSQLVMSYCPSFEAVVGHPQRERHLRAYQPNALCVQGPVQDLLRRRCGLDEHLQNVIKYCVLRSKMKAPLSHRMCTARVSIVIRASELLRKPVGNGQTRLESGLKVATPLGVFQQSANHDVGLSCLKNYATQPF